METHQLLSLPLFDHRRFEQSFHFVWPFSYVLVFLTVFLTHTPFFCFIFRFHFLLPRTDAPARKAPTNWTNGNRFSWQ